MVKTGVVSDVTPLLSPPLKWAGGKRWLLRELAPLWQAHAARRLVEPFTGGMAVPLGLRPAAALLNDANRHLMNFYRWLRRGLVIEQALVNEEAFFYAARERFNELIRTGMDESKEAAGLFYYLNRTGYNGLCRFNKRGFFNVPFGRYERINYTRDFRAYAPLIATWQLREGDFAALEREPDDFIYADPPYDVEFRAYSRFGFEWTDQERLARWLADHGGPVVVSNQATARILALYGDHGFAIRTLEGPRRIAANGDRTPALEMVATRNLT
jgi:DNA adenine methylase